MKRKILLHFHIFKNAGTTIDSVLEKNFLENAIRGDGEKPKDILSMNIVLEYVKKNKNLIAFSSHQIRFPVLKDEEVEFIPLVFIRHPLDRALSTYNFNKNRVDPISQISFEARKMSLQSYIEWNLDPPKGKGRKNQTIKNFQVLFFSHNDVESLVDSNDLNIAISNLKKCAIIGVVDRLDESLVVAEEILKKEFPNIDLSYVRRNISKGRKNTLKERLEEASDQVGKSVWNNLKKHNELDMKLYETANTELDIRIKKIENFDALLNEFKNRESKLMKHLLEYTSPFKNKRILYSFQNKNWHIENIEKRMKDAKDEDVRVHKKTTGDILVWAITGLLEKLGVVKPKTNFALRRKRYSQSGN